MYLFIINPKSGSGRSLRSWKRVREALDSKKIKHAALFTTNMAEVDKLVSDTLAQHSRWNAIVVIGGDGTIHSILPVLKRTGIPLGVIPAGSGNDTARGFGIPRDPLAALELILTGSAKAADLISAAGMPVMTAVAAGFDAQVSENVNGSRYKKICNAVGAGRLAYVIGVLHTLMTFKPGPVTVTCDGQTVSYPSAWLTAVSNVPSYGGGLVINPQAKADDGMLDVCVVHDCSRLQLLLLFPTVLKGTHVKLPIVTLFRGNTVGIRFDRPRLAQGDGEDVSALPMDFRADPGAIRIFSAL
ncbi:diacylglycerol kinase family protein [Paenibacillus sp. XY044]|uniref:diacylglycerol/lipid kinase family protein n=1 Tax=Paenibacillus sp. XY044 TaxID=2026089 RepID=UPI000B97FD89|nr:diacylglycerol kinase family protein [Paenibacillus sp. XY044]OZB90724.1 lipid kinase [Paenibacillus sp. XY044]